jgi:hypothetical protein
MWLEAHNPNEPLNFLDHRIKCGNAIVGLAHKDELENGIAMEAFKRLPEDDKDIVAMFRKGNKEEINGRDQRSFDFEKSVGRNLKTALERLNKVLAMLEHTPEKIAAKQKAYHEFQDSRELRDLGIIADIQVAQFFIPKTKENAQKIITDEQYWRHLRGELPLQGQAVAMAMAVGQEKRFFHWFLEFPQVFADGGFDCILGNPPYLGKSSIKSAYGVFFQNYCNLSFKPASGCDLITYFLRRNYDIIKQGCSFLALITTNSITDGSTREGGLDIILNRGGLLNFAVKSRKWPGTANVFVSLLTITNSLSINIRYVLDNKEVANISSFLDTGSSTKPNDLHCNEDLVYQGCKLLGDGFILTREKADYLLAISDKYNDILFPLINAKNINENPSQNSNRFAINFRDWPIEHAKRYEAAFDIVETKLKTQRASTSERHSREHWWQYARSRPELYNRLKGKEECVVIPCTTKHLSLTLCPSHRVFTHALFVYTRRSFLDFAVLQSSLHNEWARKYSGSLETRLRYSPSDCFVNFPFPQNLSDEFEATLEHIGEEYHEFRRQLMLETQLGLTKTYNQFHNLDLREFSEDDLSNIATLNAKKFQKQYGKDTVSLWKHLDKTEGTCSFNEAVRDILHLRELHKHMDETVLCAYGWHEESKYGPAINLAHDFYEVDYLPENDRVRYTISPEARKEILKRLLLLNHEIYEDEVRRGIHDKKKAKRGKGRTKAADPMQMKIDIQ